MDTPAHNDSLLTGRPCAGLGDGEGRLEWLYNQVSLSQAVQADPTRIITEPSFFGLTYLGPQ
jgi:hypothetical protein